MKFLVDAQLPMALKTWLIQQGYDVIHTRDLPRENLSSDQFIMQIAGEQERILISKVSDFFKFHLINGIPRKLLMITTGNIQNKHLLQLFEMNFLVIINLFQNGAKVVELSNDNIAVHA